MSYKFTNIIYNIYTLLPVITYCENQHCLNTDKLSLYFRLNNIDQISLIFVNPNCGCKWSLKHHLVIFCACWIDIYTYFEKSQFLFQNKQLKVASLTKIVLQMKTYLKYQMKDFISNYKMFKVSFSNTLLHSLIEFPLSWVLPVVHPKVRMLATLWYILCLMERAFFHSSNIYQLTKRIFIFASAFAKTHLAMQRFFVALR